jgi:hypothetical protein
MVPAETSNDTNGWPFMNIESEEKTYSYTDYKKRKPTKWGKVTRR